MKFAIVIPAKNEEAIIKSTLSSIADQTLLPEVCLVVDDGSNDMTSDIVKTFSETCPFIEYLYNDNQDEYILGGHIVQVFGIGKSHIDRHEIPYDYIIKLDADVSFEKNFLQKMSDRLGKEQYGIISGTPYYLENNKKIFEFSPLWHTHGQFKIYNKQCFDDIQGLAPSLGWDCADNIKAIDKGWKTAAFRDLFYQMHRKVGGKSSLKKGRINHGIGAYKLGYSLPYFLLRVVHDLFKPPVVAGSFYLLYGYTKSLFSRNTRRILNKRQIKLMRKLFWESFIQRLSAKEFILFQR